MASLNRTAQTKNHTQYDRLIVITDEQSHDSVVAPKTNRAYMVNVGSYKNGVGYGDWTRITGFSESIVRYIMQAEQNIEGR